MKYSSIFIILLVSIVHSISAQNEQDVISFLENNPYHKKVHADYYLEYGEVELPEIVKSDLEIGFAHGITNTHFFNVNKSGVETTYTSANKGLGGIGRTKALYLFKCKVLDYAEYKEEFVFSADLLGVDLMTGENIIYKNVSLSAPLKGKELSNNELIAKTVREAMTSALKYTFGTYNKVVELVEIDKDKVKKVAVMDLAFRKNSSPKNAYAFIVKTELEVDGKPFFIFEKIAELKSPEKAQTGKNRIYKVGSGKKELLAHFNAKKTVYVSNYYLGAKSN